MTSNRYVVLNCPCYTSKGGYYDCWVNQDTWCKNVTNCVIKQVIQVCNEYSDKWEDCDFSNGLSYEIFKLFNIEEINK